jgi:phosphate starvation-inducible protein PhoH and related proteins
LQTIHHPSFDPRRRLGSEQTSAHELSFEPIDNARLASLCGPFDENLRQLEAALDITISHRNERFTVSGSEEAAQHGANAIKYFYERTANRFRSELTVEDIQTGLIQLRQIRAATALQQTGHTPAPQSASAGAQPEGYATLLVTPAKRQIVARSARQAAYIKQIQSHDVTFGVGPAGTGKTYLAVACAVDAFERELVKRIVLVRPAVEAGEKLGFLPGDLAQKVDPYLRPLYDALFDLMGYERVTRLFERSAIEVAPLAFMRGRTLNNSFIILDEAQNTTPEQMKMFLTRLGYSSKAVITGDVTQVDLPRGQSGLVHARQVLAQVKGIGFSVFQSEDVVRHPLVQQIVDAYERNTLKP